MTIRSVIATVAFEKPPAAKPSRSRWLPDDLENPSVSASNKKVIIQLFGNFSQNNKIYPKFDLSRYNHYGLKLKTYMPPVKKELVSFRSSVVEK